MKMSGQTIYKFGAFSLDPRQGILSAAGREIPLAGKAFDTLRALVENAGRVVSNTVRDLVAGSGLRFVPRGEASLGRLGVWSLFAAADP